MPKKLLLDVNCQSPFDGAADFLVITLSDEMIARIKYLAAHVRELKINAIQELNGGGAYFSDDTLAHLLDTLDSENEIDEALVNAVEDDVGNVNTRQWIIYHDSIVFQGVPKHCGDESTLRTNKVAIADLVQPGILNELTR